MALTISRIDESRPPGVSIVMATALSWPAAAAWIPRCTYDAMNGSTTPVRESLSTCGLAAAPTPAAPAATPAMVTRATAVRARKAISTPSRTRPIRP
ncbi:MAG: hypothetical protein E6G66_04205 [Actinobacteria bacterium]|nr:MAG: hypothetical protein E6G66_04205 [Actinomycetota bacterium]